MLSPLDGRYGDIVKPLNEFLSEEALNRTRVATEVEWLIFLSASGAIATLRPLSPQEERTLRSYASGFGPDEARDLKRIEDETGHDVKAVEYYIKRLVATTSMADVSEFVHFCCTSEDINNLSYGVLLRRAVTEVWLPAASALVGQIATLAESHRNRPMLARTHGQAATPTTVGKELAVFAHRLGRQLKRVERQEYLGKFNGATGTYSAHVAAAPHVDWISLSRRFVESLGLTWNPLTTQIESHDYMAEVFGDVARFNGILNNFNTDVWHYVSLGYFRQAKGNGSVGSSTMPHKINPIRFENSEANVEVSNALLNCLADSLITSRMQRDLSDSSMLRNIGPALGHAMVALSNTSAGLRGLQVDAQALDADLQDAWEVLGEACQSVMRRAGIDRPYERLKDLTRGVRVTEKDIHDFLKNQPLDTADMTALLALTPATYTGLAAKLVDFAPGVHDPVPGADRTSDVP
jgi:adenylosuccinate lyase